MKNILRKWGTTLLSAVFILCTVFALLALSANTLTANAATTVGTDGSKNYNGGTQSYTKSIASLRGSGSNVTNNITYTWGGAADDKNYIKLDPGATYTVTATNIPNVDRLLYARLMIYPRKNYSFNVTMSISYGSKSASYDLNTSTQDSYNFYVDIRGGNGNSVTWTVKNNSSSTTYISQGFCDISYARNYTVNFDKKSGSGGTDSISVWHYFSYSKITPPTRSGYNFLGYFDAATGGTKYFNANGTVSKSAWDKRPADYLNPKITLYAQWEVAEQTVNVAAGTGVSSVYLSTNQKATSGSASGSKFNSGNTVYAFAKLAKGYNAKSGWTLVSGKANTEGAIYRVSSKTVGASTVNFGTISADLATYDITYNLDHGTVDGTNPATYNMNTATFTLKNPTKTGYTFAGWTGANGEVPQMSVSVEKGSVGNRTYTANWTANKYTVNIDGIGEIEAEYGKKLDISSYTMPTITGYTFAGFFAPNSLDYIGADGKGTRAWNYSESGILLHAKFTKDMTVTSAGYTGAYDGQPHTITVSASDPDNPAIIGFEIKYGTTDGTYDLTEAPTYTNGGTYTVYYEVTNATYYRKDGNTVFSGYTTVHGSEQVVITPKAVTSVIFDKLPEAITGLVYNNENYALITAGTLVDDGNDYGNILYRVVANDNSVNTQYGTAIPTGLKATTYTVYYTTSGNANYAPYPEASFTVTIAEVDKTALTDLIDDVNGYLDTISDKYPVVAATLEGHKQQIANDYVVEPNVTATQVADAVDELRGYLNAAKAAVEEAKIDAIGNVAYTPESKALIDDASDYFSDELNDTQKALVSPDKVAALNAAIDLYNDVDEVVEQIKAIGDSEDTKAFRDKVEAARKAYDQLGDDRKAIFPEDILKILTDDEAAIVVMDKINNIGDVVYTEECAKKIKDAVDAYEELTDDQKALVANYDKLLDAIADYDAVDEAVEKVNAIGEVEYTPECKELIDNARKTYEDLTEYQKSIFPKDVLKALEDAEKAYDFMDKSNAIGIPANTDEFREKVEAAREAYDDLTEDQEALVTPSFVTDLENAEAVVDAMDKVNDIGEVEFTPESKELIDGARETYESLSDDQKKLFPKGTLKEIADAEEKYARLKADHEAADVVIAKIDAIGSVTYTSASNNKILSAKAAYNSLTASQKALVSNYQTLKKAETTFAHLRADNKAADSVIAKINDIGNVSYDDVSYGKISIARAAYNALSSNQKALVSNYFMLRSAESAYEQLRAEHSAAEEVEEKIDAIGVVELTDECNEKIANAREAYNALPASQKTFVGNYATLTAAEEEYAKLKSGDYSANEVIAKINAIGAVEYTDECYAKIASARAAYDVLASGEKALVTNYPTLTAAEEAYAKLKADNEAASAVIAKINAIGTVKYTDECHAKITSARAAYDALTSEQKALVTNYPTLTAAEEAYAKLKEESLTLSLKHDESKVTLTVKTGSGIPNNIQLTVDVKAALSAKEGSAEYNKIKTMLEKNEKISKVYDVKLIQTIDGVKTEIQPSDIEDGMIITVIIELPDGMQTKNLKILHVHSDDDMEFVDNFKIDGNKVSFDIDRLSEFVFITTNNGLLVGAIVAIIVAMLAVCVVIVIVVISKKKKSDKADK